MLEAINHQNQWEETLLSSFFDMVRASDGDFSVVDQLARASNDLYTLQAMIERLSSTVYGK